MEGTLTPTYDKGLYHSLRSSVLKDIAVDNGIDWGKQIDLADLERMVVSLKQVDPYKVSNLNEQQSAVLGSLITSLWVEIEAVLCQLPDEGKNKDLRCLLDIDWS